MSDSIKSMVRWGALLALLGIAGIGAGLATGAPGRTYAAPQQMCEPDPNHSFRVFENKANECTSEGYGLDIPLATLQTHLACDSGVYSFRAEIEICNFDPDFPPTITFFDGVQAVTLPFDADGVVESDCLPTWPEAFELRGGGVPGRSLVGDLESFDAFCCICGPGETEIDITLDCDPTFAVRSATISECPTGVTSFDLDGPLTGPGEVCTELDCDRVRETVTVFLCDPVATAPTATATTIGGATIPIALTPSSACDAGQPCDTWLFTSDCISDQNELIATVHVDAPGTGIEQVVIDFSCCETPDGPHECEPGVNFATAFFECDDNQHVVQLDMDECDLQCQDDLIQREVYVALCEPTTVPPTLRVQRPGGFIETLPMQPLNPLPSNEWLFFDFECKPRFTAFESLTVTHPTAAIIDVVAKIRCCNFAGCDPFAAFATRTIDCQFEFTMHHVFLPQCELSCSDQERTNVVLATMCSPIPVTTQVQVFLQLVGQPGFVTRLMQPSLSMCGASGTCRFWEMTSATCEPALIMAAVQTQIGALEHITAESLCCQAP